MSLEKQIQALYESASIITVHSLEITTIITNMVSERGKSFEGLSFTSSDLHLLQENARFEILKSYYQRALEEPSYDDFIDILTKIYNITHYHIFSSKENNDYIKEMELKKNFLIAKYDTKKWLDSSLTSLNTSISLSKIWENLAYAGLVDTENPDYLYDPGFKKVGLTPEVVDNKLAEVRLHQFNIIDKDYSRKLSRFLKIPDLLDTSINTVKDLQDSLSECNYTIEQWYKKTNATQDIINFVLKHAN